MFQVTNKQFAGEGWIYEVCGKHLFIRFTQYVEQKISASEDICYKYLVKQCHSFIPM